MSHKIIIGPTNNLVQSWLWSHGSNLAVACFYYFFFFGLLDLLGTYINRYFTKFPKFLVYFFYDFIFTNNLK